MQMSLYRVLKHSRWCLRIVPETPLVKVMCNLCDVYKHNMVSL